MKQLDRIDTENALAALEFFASNIDDDLAKPLIRKIATARSREACLSLVRIALAHSSAEIRKLTADSIRKYPMSHYVPELLNKLVGETHVESRLVMQPNGNVSLEVLFQNELQDRKQVSRAQKLVNVVSVFSSSHNTTLFSNTQADVSYWSEFWKVPKAAPAHFGKVTTKKEIIGSGSSSMQSKYVPQVVAKGVAENLLEQGKQQERAVDMQNRDLKERVNRVCTLLRATTFANLDDSPEAWWSWWNEHNERYQTDKPTAYSYNAQNEKLVIASRTMRSNRHETMHDLGPMLIQYSCLVPGTVVQTSNGLVPIEAIQIGDLVLSQDVESAELTLKPVIMTTVRPPKSTFRIATEGKTIEATGGHLWWVSGLGWTKTRDLRPGMQLHTVTGTCAVTNLDVNPGMQTTHNLVVDGFHTYFVGPERVLSYDNTLMTPTLRQLPGYGKTNEAGIE